MSESANELIDSGNYTYERDASALDTVTLPRAMADKLVARVEAADKQLAEINSIVDNFATPDEAQDTPQWRVQLCKWSLDVAMDHIGELGRAADDGAAQIADLHIHIWNQDQAMSLRDAEAHAKDLQIASLAALLQETRGCLKAAADCNFGDVLARVEAKLKEVRA